MRSGSATPGAAPASFRTHRLNQHTARNDSLPAAAGTRHPVARPWREPLDKSGLGPDNDYQYVLHNPPTPATAYGQAQTLYTVASASVDVSGDGTSLSLESHADLTVPASLDFASAFAAATAYREFRITDGTPGGGSGPIQVRFSFHYSGRLYGTEDPSRPPSFVDYSANVRVSDGTTTWEVAVGERRTTPVDHTVDSEQSETLLLEYNVPYWIAASVDPEGGSSPEPAAAAVAAGLGLCACSAFRRLAQRPLRDRDPAAAAGA